MKKRFFVVLDLEADNIPHTPADIAVWVDSLDASTPRIWDIVELDNA